MQLDLGIAGLGLLVIFSLGSASWPTPVRQAVDTVGRAGRGARLVRGRARQRGGLRRHTVDEIQPSSTAGIR